NALSIPRPNHVKPQVAQDQRSRDNRNIDKAIPTQHMEMLCGKRRKNNPWICFCGLRGVLQRVEPRPSTVIRLKLDVGSHQAKVPAMTPCWRQPCRRGTADLSCYRRHSGSHGPTIRDCTAGTEALSQWVAQVPAMTPCWRQPCRRHSGSHGPTIRDCTAGTEALSQWVAQKRSADQCSLKMMAAIVMQQNQNPLRNGKNKEAVDFLCEKGKIFYMSKCEKKTKWENELRKVVEIPEYG
ncbi:hypothetical protein HGM15179_009024, partial [Zosterops borbonicus]